MNGTRCRLTALTATSADPCLTRRLVTATLLAARSKAAQATNNLSRGDRYMTTLAARFFHEDGLDQNELAATAHRIHEALTDADMQRLQKLLESTAPFSLDHTTLQIEEEVTEGLLEVEKAPPDG